MGSDWPRKIDVGIDIHTKNKFEELKEMITAVRTSRSELNVPPSAQVHVSTKDFHLPEGGQESTLLKVLCKVLDVKESKQRPPKTALAVVKGGELYIHLEGLIDLKAEAAKQQKEREKLEKYIQSINGKLSNGQFVKNAPQELVDAEKAKLQEAGEKIERINNNLRFLEQ